MYMTPWHLNLVAVFVLIVSAVVSGQEEKEKSHCTSVAGMVNLLQIESNLIENLSNYADELEKKLHIVRGFVSEMRTQSDKAMVEPEHFVSNPLNAFSLIRRMHEDWTRWQHYMEQPVGLQQIDFLRQQRHQLPTSTDLEEACFAIYRIQSTYDLRVSDIAKGLLSGREYNVSLNALDSYALGKYHFDQQKFGEAMEWIYQAIQWLQRDQKLPLPLSLDRTEVYHVYAEAFVKMKRYNDALTTINSALSLREDNVKLLLRKTEVETLIRTEPNVEPIPYLLQEVGAYERGCRGEFLKPSRLHCVYNQTNSPFLRLAPLKTEVIELDPYMVIYHDVISPKEISQLQSMSVSELKRATVLESKTGKNVVANTRTAQVAWFADTHNELTMRISRRIEDMTRFDLYDSEMFQAMNYGLGGHYDTHFDYFNSTVETTRTRENGDRIATVLFYLTDVEQGGATVFPNIEKAVFPQKGSAIMWYNLNDDGQGNTKTLHAACPVIVGSKWVTNKWIRERRQLFRRPCVKNK